MVITYVNNVLIFDVCVEGTARSNLRVRRSSKCQQPCKSALKITNFLETKVKSQKNFYPAQRTIICSDCIDCANKTK
jgi:hypothetical protein